MASKTTKHMSALFVVVSIAFVALVIVLVLHVLGFKNISIDLFGVKIKAKK